jgi:hypothetical protein
VQCVASRAYWQERGRRLQNFFPLPIDAPNEISWNREFAPNTIQCVFLILKIAKFLHFWPVQNGNMCFKQNRHVHILKKPIVTVQDLWRFATFLTPQRSHCLIPLISLKVDGIEIWGGSGRRQLFGYGLALRRSGVILNLNVPFLCTTDYFRFHLLQLFK